MLCCIVAVDPFSRFQRSVFLSGRGHSYFVAAPGLPLSLKCMFNGRAVYKFDRSEVAVDDNGYLILNEDQPYSIEIASPTLVESFVLWFPRGWAEEVLHVLTHPSEKLVDDAAGDHGYEQASFFSRYTRHDNAVSPLLRTMRAAIQSRQVMQDNWLEEKLRELLASMLANQRILNTAVEQLPAVRASTRAELWRRANRARDYLHANLASRVSLEDVASVACLSPFHLLRVFQSAFRQTPHQYLISCRIERAKFLLTRTHIPITAICLECGFTSLGSFSALFHRYCGMSPRLWRQRHGVFFRGQNSKIREVYLMGGSETHAHEH